MHDSCVCCSRQICLNMVRANAAPASHASCQRWRPRHARRGSGDVFPQGLATTSPCRKCVRHMHVDRVCARIVSRVHQSGNGQFYRRHLRLLSGGDSVGNGPTRREQTTEARLDCPSHRVGLRGNQLCLGCRSGAWPNGCQESKLGRSVRFLRRSGPDVHGWRRANAAAWWAFWHAASRSTSMAYVLWVVSRYNLLLPRPATGISRMAARILRSCGVGFFAFDIPDLLVCPSSPDKHVSKSDGCIGALKRGCKLRMIRNLPCEVPTQTLMRLEFARGRVKGLQDLVFHPPYQRAFERHALRQRPSQAQWIQG